MSEQRSPHPPVLDYHRPTAKPLALHWGRYVPGVVALSLLIVPGMIEYEYLFLGLPCSIVLALVQVICSLENAPDSFGQRRQRVLRVPLLLGILIFITSVTIYAVLPMPGYATEQGNRRKCAGNLGQIDRGITLYANDFGGAYPESLVPLLTECDLGLDVFLCPSGDGTESHGSNLKAIAEDLARPGHISYVYLGAGIHRSSVRPDMVIAYEELKNHDKDGINVLYGDGQVKWLERQDAEYLLNELKAGRNPPR